MCQMSSTGHVGKSLFVTVPDGLKLHVREYGTRMGPGLPVVCLAGLVRTVATFEDLAPALANVPPCRRVIAIDSRGRGGSDYDENPANYCLPVELGDVVTVLNTLAVGPAVFVGSSRGGLLTMLLGAMLPAAIAGVVLHDIGPVIETGGLARIRGYVGRLPQPRDFQQGADILCRMNKVRFPKLTKEQWLGIARRAWRMTNGKLEPTYDVRLANAFDKVDIERTLPPLWNEFDALANVPMLVIHAANSDILSSATVTAMRERRAEIEIIEVPDQGHVPLFDDDNLLGKIARFVENCDFASRAQLETNLAT